MEIRNLGGEESFLSAAVHFIIEYQNVDRAD